ncbi:IS110 family transposase [Streptomyces sp. NBC_01264]|uniref:IS110 family transposase n=1 Tax=Streptomyces sp. NBC_01264 TaxID=2903804 RepID=UPI002252DA9D|nr:transposase [Streptomyces sp. NBC_01264]MCX4781682.1 transposase [Streptomyces sp. NBC_01264]
MIGREGRSAAPRVRDVLEHAGLLPQPGQPLAARFNANNNGLLRQCFPNCMGDSGVVIGVARQWPQRRWAVENARGLGRHLTSWLIARGEEVVDVAPSATARVRQLSRGGGRKNDRIDAAAAACVAALQGDARPVQPENSTDALGLLDERRNNLAQARVRAVNQPHALLRALLPGGAPRDLSAAKAELLLESAVPCGPAEFTRHDLAADLIAEIRAWDVKLKDNAKARASLVAESESRLTDTPGIGAVTAARLLGRTGNPLKRRLADHVWRTMIADERRRTRTKGPGGQQGRLQNPARLAQTPTAGSSDESLPGPAKTEPMPPARLA